MNQSNAPLYLWKMGEKEAIFSPLNGSEPTYDPRKWNLRKNITRTHNCYAYLLDIVNNNFRRKPQPGYASGKRHMSDRELRDCDKIMERIRADNPSVIPSSLTDKCPRGYRKGYFAIDTGEDPDYHFYRLDKSGKWSHKPGSTKAVDENFDGKKIVAPHLAKRESSSHTYDRSCGYFCFDPSQSRISNKIT